MESYGETTKLFLPPCLKEISMILKNIPNVNDLRKQLDIIFACAPGAHEIRVIGRYYHTSLDGKKLERVLAKDSGDPQAYAIHLARTPKEAVEIITKHFNDYEAHNCYMALNRVSDQFKIKVRPFQIGDREYPIALSCTKIKDIQGICALIIDLDREVSLTNGQGVKLAASPEELKALDLARQDIIQELERYDLNSNYQMMSGNGYQIVYFFPVQTDTTKTRKTIASILEILNQKYTGRVSVDTAMSDPARVARLCGLWNKKPERAEDKSQERVHRIANFLDGQSELNRYENIEELACALKAWQEQTKVQRKASAQKQPSKKTETQTNQQDTAPSKGDDQLWIDEHLGKIRLLDVLPKFYSVSVTGQSRGKTQLLCPYHEDHSPSAWIDSSNTVDLLHCSSPHCQVYHHAKNALHVYQDNGYTFLKACQELFGTVPPSYYKQCYTCRQPIFLDGKKRCNLDATKHTCRSKKQGSRKRKEKSEESNTNGESSDRPTLLLRCDLETKTRDIVTWLHENNTPPCIFVRGRELVRVVQVGKKDQDRKQAMIEEMDAKGLRAFLNERLRFVRRETDEDGTTKDKLTDLPLSVADNLLARSSWPFPALEEIIRNPTLGRDGRIILSDGYRPDMQAWVDLGGLKVDVPACPTEAEVQEAKHLILDELLGEFPFADLASRANTVALGLLMFVRHIIDGCTPQHLVSAPVRGSGKSLLVEALCWVATGVEPDSLTEGRDDDEWRKRITAVLLKSPALIRIDNVTSKLESGALSSVLTSRVWSDRLLGFSQTVSVRNNAVWTATANNPQLSEEIARRCVWIHLDPKMACPEDRTGFRHDPLLPWVKENRAALVRAFLILIQNWIAKGMPRAKVRVGSFEDWAAIVGGILEASGISGFLENRKALTERSDTEIKEWRAFIAVWWEKYQTESVSASTLRQMAFDNDLLGSILGDNTERSQKIRMGRALQKMQDRVLDRWRIELGKLDTDRKINMWRLVEIVT